MSPGAVAADSVTVVVPTIGRPSLQRTLAPLAGLTVVVVDDRPGVLALDVPAGTSVLRSGGRGPAAARNVGWRAATTPWVAFLDDDVQPPETWAQDLLRDLGAAGRRVGGVQGRIVVPVPERPTDWERSTQGLEAAAWATADLAYRREVLARVGGFDERFPRAYREDADLGVRVTDAGWLITTGERVVVHPVRPARWTQSIPSQRGNADDVLMRALHGRDWRRRAQVPQGRRRWHLATTAGLLAVGHRRTRLPGALLWVVLTADFAGRRIAPGPRTPAEMATMVATSAVLPVAATWHWLAGWARLGRLLSQAGPAPGDSTGSAARGGQLAEDLAPAAPAQLAEEPPPAAAGHLAEEPPPAAPAQLAEDRPPSRRRTA